MNRQIQNRLESGNLFCHFAVDHIDGWREFLAYIWYPGGTKNGAHQPRTIVAQWPAPFSRQSEAYIRAAVEAFFPGIVYRQIPVELDR